MKKGFTLIELLAVIVILAIIAVIAVPIILGIINDAKKESSMRSAELYLKAAELAIARENLNGEVNITSCTVKDDGNLLCNGKTIKVEMDGDIATGGTITFTNGKISSVTNLTISGQTYKTNSSGTLVIDADSSSDNGTEGFTGTIYRHSSEALAIGDSIKQETKSVYCGDVKDGDVIIGTSCSLGNIGWDNNAECISGMNSTFGISVSACEEGVITTGISNYEIDSSDITYDLYLKHDIENDIVQASYVCIRYVDDNVDKESCLMGGNPDYYGTFEEKNGGSENLISVTNPTGNVDILSGVKNYFGYCRFNELSSSKHYSHCSNSYFNYYAYDDGEVIVTGATYNNGINCQVTFNGYSACWTS